VTRLEAFALFGAPVLMFATGLAAYYLTLPRDGRHGSPAE
jgi:hypothetical protein